MEYIQNPMKIEQMSFSIIDDEIEAMGRVMPSLNPIIHHIYRRVIHTSADFDYLDQLKVSERLVESLSSYVHQPLIIYTDTNMALSGINKKALGTLGWSARCLITDPEVVTTAKKLGITRSMASVMMSLQAPGEKLYVFGNAPTSIFKLLEYKEQPLFEKVVGVIGVPVGFVGAEESKQMLYESGVPAIVALGRKGGSNVAAAIVNAMMYELGGR